jgi:hypothetical protein
MADLVTGMFVAASMQQGDAYFLKADGNKRESLSRFNCFSQSLSNANCKEGRQGVQLVAAACHVRCIRTPHLPELNVHVICEIWCPGH